MAPNGMPSPIQRNSTAGSSSLELDRAKLSHSWEPCGVVFMVYIRSMYVQAAWSCCFRRACHEDSTLSTISCALHYLDYGVAVDWAVTEDSNVPNLLASTVGSIALRVPRYHNPVTSLQILGLVLAPESEHTTASGTSKGF